VKIKRNVFFKNDDRSGHIENRIFFRGLRPRIKEIEDACIMRMPAAKLYSDISTVLKHFKQTSIKESTSDIAGVSMSLCLRSSI